MRGKFVLALNGDQLVLSCLSIVQELSPFQGVLSEKFHRMAIAGKMMKLQRKYLAIIITLFNTSNKCSSD